MSASDIRDPFRGLTGPDRRRAVKRTARLLTVARGERRRFARAIKAARAELAS